MTWSELIQLAPQFSGNADVYICTPDGPRLPLITLIPDGGTGVILKGAPDPVEGQHYA